MLLIRYPASREQLGLIANLPIKTWTFIMMVFFDDEKCRVPYILRLLSRVITSPDSLLLLCAAKLHIFIRLHLEAQ